LLEIAGFFYAQNHAMLASKWGGHKKREQREARLVLRWFVRNSDKEGSFERSEKNQKSV